MADERITDLVQFPASPTSATGTSADLIEFLDVNDTTLAPTGSNKKINMVDLFSTFIGAGTNVTVTKQTAGGGVVVAAPSTGLTINQWVSTPTVATVTSNACTCDASVADKYTVALGSGAVTTITIANVGVGSTLEITTFQPSGGSVGTITWAGQTIRWSAGITGAPTATLNKGDTFVFSCRSTGIVAGGVALPNF